MPNRRILLLITDLEIGGTPTVVRELATRLRPYAHVEVACLKQWGPVADQLREAGVEVTPLDASGVWQWSQTIGALGRMLKQKQIDTIFSFLIHANFVASRVVRRSGVRLIQSIQTVQPRPRWHWWLQGKIAMQAEKIIVPSTAIVEAAVERCGLARDLFAVIPNALDPQEFGQAPVFQGRVARAGFLGRLDANKQPELLVDALARCDGEVELHFYGDGPRRPRLVALADARGLRQRVKFHGFVARPQDALREMDVLWMPSPIEGFGLVLIEAMAAGVPVIATAAGGAAEVVQDGINGLAVSSAGPEGARGFASGLQRLRDDEGLRSRLIAGGLRSVHERYSWDVVLPAYRTQLQI